MEEKEEEEGEEEVKAVKSLNFILHIFLLTYSLLGLFPLQSRGHLDYQIFISFHSFEFSSVNLLSF